MIKSARRSSGESYFRSVSSPHYGGSSQPPKGTNYNNGVTVTNHVIKVGTVGSVGVGGGMPFVYSQVAWVHCVVAR